MTRCLNEKTLLLLHDGEGTGAQRTHLTECETCAARYRQLGRDLEAICQVLREEPPPKTASPRLRPFTVRWVPAAAAVILALVLMWEGVRIWSPSAPAPLTGTTSEEIGSLAEEFSPELLLLNQALAGELWTVSADPYEAVAAALESDRPCEWYDMLPRSEGESFEGEFGADMPCVELNLGSKKRSPDPRA